MQEKYSGESLQPVSVILDNDEEANTIAFALERLIEAAKLEAITAPEEVRDRLPDALDTIKDLAVRIDGGEREIPVGHELTYVGTALHKLVDDFDAAMTDIHAYEAMTEGLNPAEFYLHVCMARDLLFATDKTTTTLEQRGHSD